MRTLIALLSVVVLSVAIAGVALAQTGNGYDLTWWTVDGGGGTLASSGTYTLTGTAGQPDAGAALTSNDYTLVGGFWPGGASGAAEHRVYLPLVVRSR